MNSFLKTIRNSDLIMQYPFEFYGNSTGNYPVKI